MCTLIKHSCASDHNAIISTSTPITALGHHACTRPAPSERMPPLRLLPCRPPPPSATHIISSRQTPTAAAKCTSASATRGLQAQAAGAPPSPPAAPPVTASGKARRGRRPLPLPLPSASGNGAAYTTPLLRCCWPLVCMPPPSPSIHRSVFFLLEDLPWYSIISGASALEMWAGIQTAALQQPEAVPASWDLARVKPLQVQGCSRRTQELPPHRRLGSGV